MRLITVVALFVWALGCADPTTLELVLVHDDALDPELDFTTADVLVIGLGAPDVDGDEEVALMWSGSAGDLLAGIPLPEVDGLVVGEEHIAAVSFGASSGCVAAPRVVGRSLVFEHEEKGERVTMAVGCAEEINPTRGRPTTGRLAHGLAATLDGRAIVAGGVERFDPSVAPLPWRAPVRGVEIYDVRSGRFETSGELATDRIAPAVLRLSGGEVAAMGGLSVEDSPGCLATQEIVWPAPREGIAALDAPRCTPSAAVIDSGRVLVHGGRTDEPTLATLDESLSTLVSTAPLTMSPMRGSPQLIPIGSSAFSIGGDGFDEPRVEVLVSECDGAPGGCALPIPIDPLEDPGPGWVGMTGGVVGCIEGGDVTTGALFITGGGIKPAPSAEPDVTLDTVYCMLITADLADWELNVVGTLPAPRRGHRTLLVTDGSGVTDMLLVGGTNQDGDLADSVLFEARGCTCTIADVKSVPMPGAPSLLLHDAAVLSDGSVLVVGGGVLNLAEATYDATAWAGVYFPDVVVP